MKISDYNNAHIARLREVPQPPLQVYAEGAWPTDETKLLAVVGSRALTPYGKEACEKLIADLSGYPISIVSGLALGADSVAHKSALRAGLHTIAVPGSGLHESVLYPRSNVGLAKEILESGGLLLSEHDEHHKAAPYDFPSRNRIMVGLSHAVLMVEAGPQSGTLITARLTHEYNRELLCVPHRIGDVHSHGAHTFIRLGATLVADASHILEILGLTSKEKDAHTLPPLSPHEKIIYDALEEPLPKDELLRIVSLSVSEALSALILLELKGVLKEEFGAWRRV